MITGRDRLNEIITHLNEALGGKSFAPTEGPNRLIYQEVIKLATIFRKCSTESTLLTGHLSSLQTTLS
jgi:hypothetical protein